MEILLSFWRWLMHANAKRVLYYSLVCLLGVSAWWMWKEFAPPSSLTGIQHGAPDRAKHTQIEAVRLMDKQLAVSASVSGDPFVLRSYRRWRWTRPRKRTTSTPVSPRPTKPTTAKTTRVTPGETSIGLVYHGMWILTDGKTGARIENRTSKTAGFYSPGDKLYWMKVIKVEQDYVEIESPDGKVVRLRRGSPIIFRKGGYGD